VGSPNNVHGRAVLSVCTPVPMVLIGTATLCTLIDIYLCKPDDVQARLKHVADLTSCRIQLSIVLCIDGLIE